MAKAEKVLEIRRMELVKGKVRVMGDTPLIMHAWDEKAKLILANPELAKLYKKDPRNPVHSFIQSMYWITEKPQTKATMAPEDCEELFAEAVRNGAKWGFPVTAFKQAAISAAYRMGWSKDKMSLRGAFYIDADENGLVEIHSDTPVLREDMVKIGMGTADIRWRGEFRNWYADLDITYNASGQYSLEDIINIINAGGYICGVGEWRPERDGQYGMYHVVTT